MTLILIPIVSAVIGALIGTSLAFVYQSKAEIRKEKRAILQALMMYRNVGAGELDWIKALNVIDLVYHNHPKVIELYHKYLACTDPAIFHTQQHLEVYVQLLYAMAQCTGYKNLTETNIRQIYAPEGLIQHYPHRFGGISPPTGGDVSGPLPIVSPKVIHPE